MVCSLEQFKGELTHFNKIRRTLTPLKELKNEVENKKKVGNRKPTKFLEAEDSL